MKTGKVLKNADINVSEQELELINKYTRRVMSADEVYVFSVVLCDNDIDRDYERFTVESLFKLQELFVGKTGIFDHDPRVENQTARIISCKVEAVDGKKTATGDDYFRLVARAYLPKSEKNADLILSIDSGILKEVSVGCAVKQTLCSICSNDINSVSCSHSKGQTYNNQLCYGELVYPYDAYEFSFVAIPAQKNAGVIKAFSKNIEEKKNMNDVISALKKGEELMLKSYETKGLFDYINELEKKAKDGECYKDQLKKNVLRLMGLEQPHIDTQTLKGILEKLSVLELESLQQAYNKKTAQCEPLMTQLKSHKAESSTCAKETDKNNQFTI